MVINVNIFYLKLLITNFNPLTLKTIRFALILVVLKLVFSLYHLELAKNLNNELSPVSDVYKIYAIQQLISKPAPAAGTNSKNGSKKGAKRAEPKVVSRTDVEAAPVQNNQNTQSAQIETQKQPEVKQVVETTTSTPAQEAEHQIELRAESEQPN